MPEDFSYTNKKVNSNYDYNSKVTQDAFDSVIPKIAEELGRFYKSPVRGNYIFRSNINEDMLDKVDAVAYLEDGRTINIQYRFWSLKSYARYHHLLMVRLNSYSKRLNSWVKSEFYNGGKIDIFVTGFYNENTEVTELAIIDWKYLFPFFNSIIFPRCPPEEFKLHRQQGHYCFYNYEFKDGNTMVQIPISHQIIDRIDKSLENMWPEAIIYKNF